jgi:subtilase family serine protease
VIDFSGTWADPELEEALEDAQGDPLSYLLELSLEPGAGTVISVEYERGRNDREDLPVTISATIDGDGRVRECEESNNSIDRAVEGGARVADLRVEIESATGCSEPVVEVTVSNDGSAAAEDVLVRIYAGDPSRGGTLLGEETLRDALEPGDSESVTLELDPVSRDITVWAVVDPRNVVDECNEGNNRDAGPSLACDTVPR